MDVGLMVEGQHGLTWERWRHILALAERLGFPTVFRSDHWFLAPDRQQDSLEAYVSFVVAALETSRLRFGPLVTPITFREPVNVGRMAAQIDVLSGGRFVMGLGAGWNEAEHRAYGLAFPPVGERFDRLEDAIGLLRALWGEHPASYEGRFYRLEGASCLPRPEPARPPLLIGGVGERRTLRIAAEHAAEWNATPLPPEAYAAKLEVLQRHCEALGRDPGSLRRSMMMFGLVGRTEQQVEALGRRVLSLWGAGGSLGGSELRDFARKRGMLVGTTDEAVDQLGELARLGLHEVVFQHFDFDSDELPDYLAGELAPRVKSL